MYFLPSLIGLISDWKKYLLTNQAKQIRPQRLAGTQVHRFYVKRNNCTVFTTPGTEAEVRYLYRDRNLLWGAEGKCNGTTRYLFDKILSQKITVFYALFSEIMLHRVKERWERV